ncbi:hypothetical protein N0V82_010872 [Gnomoniopsis sp. IMI 355080]|nr:hypothetical protein N0V82_010872 [Gnomoniopsis sp. IMI 355080]
MQTKASPPADRHRYPPPLILPVKREDVGPIAIFSFEATSWSPMGSFFNQSPDDGAKAVQNLEATLMAALEDPDRFTVMKAVDPDTGELASYATWERNSHDRGRKDVDIEAKIIKAEHEGKKHESNNDQNPAEAAEKEESANVDPRRRFGTHVAAETARFRDAWAAGMDYVEMRGMATAPRFQRRGYATALLDWGHRRELDAERRVGFLVGSPVARPLYASHGWHEVGQIVVDMCEFVPGAKAGDRGWGMWKLYHMIRLPRAVI